MVDIEKIIKEKRERELDEDFLDKIDVLISDESMLTDDVYSPILNFTLDNYDKVLEFAKFCLKQGKFILMKDVSEKII